MGKKTIGKRPIPKVATGPSPSLHTRSGSYSGTKGSKGTIGNRPTPAVAHNTPHPNTKTNAVKPAIKHKSMPHSRQDQTTGASRAAGGGRKGGY